MDDWDSLEKVIRRRLTDDLPVRTSGMLRDTGFEAFKSKRTLMFDSTQLYGLAKKEDGTEEWFVHKTDGWKVHELPEHVQFYKNWKEYYNAFSEEQIENLRQFGVVELLNENKEVIDTIKETDIRNTMASKSRYGYDTQGMFSALWTRILKLEQMMTEIYNAPGMPGCLAAQKSFENQQNQKL